MSQENIDLALAFTAAYNERDIETAVGFCAENVTGFPDTTVFPEADSLSGREEFRRMLEETLAAWTSCAHTPEEILEIGADRVLIRGRWGGKGTASGIEIYQDLCAVFTIRDAQISKAEWFFGREKALEALGLSE